MGKESTPPDQPDGLFCLRTGWRGIDSLEERATSELKDYAETIGVLRRTAKVDIQRLPFYKAAWLLRLKIKNMDVNPGVYMIWSRHGCFTLCGSSRSIYAANQREYLHLEETTALAYLTFFCFFTHAEAGPFRILFDVKDLNATAPPNPEKATLLPKEVLNETFLAMEKYGELFQQPVAYKSITPASLQRMILTPVISYDSNNAFWFAISFVQFGDRIFISAFCISDDGAVDMLNDQPLISDIPIDAWLNKKIDYETLGFDNALTLPPENNASTKDTPPCLFSLRTGWHLLDSLNEEEKDALKHFSQFEGAMKAIATTAIQPLPFYQSAWLVRLQLKNMDVNPGIHLIWSSHGLFPLPGISMPVHVANIREKLRLDDQTALAYVTFFCSFVHGDEGPFRLLFDVEGMNTTSLPNPKQEILPPQECLNGQFLCMEQYAELFQEPIEYKDLSHDSLARMIHAPSIAYDADDAFWIVMAFVQYGDGLFVSAFKVASNGIVEMLDDRVLIANIPIDIRLNKIADIGWQDCIDTPTALPDIAHKIRRWKTRAQDASERCVEARVQQAYVRFELVNALRNGAGEPLYKADIHLEPDELLEDVARFMFDTQPLILIESDIPYVEKIVIDLLTGAADVKPVRKAIAMGASGIDNTITVPDFNDGDVLLVSMHDTNRLTRPEAVAYQLGVTDALALIGCDSQALVPEALRRSSDMVIPIDQMDAAIFKKLFCHLFDCDWPDYYPIDDALWLRYVEPADLYLPLRQMLQNRQPVNRPTGQSRKGANWHPSTALDLIKKRVVGRLYPADVADCPDLDDIHGLGEARAIVQDLIRDVRDVVQGKIGWEQVDRGVMIVGPPGTGKTMLARSMAKACHVRFISTSAAGWIAGTEHLGFHLRRIHDVFAEARRYAPSILFIDEIDSIGNRDNFQGKNRQYCVEVVNAVLQELQGIYERQGVFVVGATNDMNRVDPALYRAGRLDQVVEITPPDRESLTAILAYYLQPFATQGRVGDDIDCQELAGVALGCTGADIVVFVRDAARRARKEGVLIQNRHLAAAITLSPRITPVSAMNTRQQAQTAAHEAGHALALLLCEHYPAEISMMSIIPRADGSLGFVGTTPGDRCAFTRHTYLEYLEVLLAGRAAEELIYGKDGVTGGAGGSSASSDLALGTQIVADMTCHLGMGGDGLLWKQEPDNSEQIESVLHDAYERVTEKLQQNRELLDAIRQTLLDKQEVVGQIIRDLAAKHGLKKSARAGS